MDPRRCIHNGFANGRCAHSYFYAACTSRHEPSMIPKALKIATVQKKMAPIPHTSPYLSFYGRLYGGNMCQNVTDTVVGVKPRIP